MISKSVIGICVLLSFIFAVSPALMSAEFCSFEIREVIDSKIDNGSIKHIPYSNNNGETELIVLKDIPEIVISSQFVKDVDFNVLNLRDNEYVKNSRDPIEVSFDISFLKKINDFIKENVNKRVAVLVCNKIIEIPSVINLSKISENNKAGLTLSYKSSLDKKIALIANLGIAPKYSDIYVKPGPPDYKNIVKNYKFNSPFDKTMDIYPTTLYESEFWVTKEETPIFYENNQHKIMLPNKFYVEQLFSSNTFKWEVDNDLIKIENPYGAGEAWIKRSSIVPFFSTLNTDLFVGTFFINNEKEWQLINEKKEYYLNNLTPAKWKKIEGVRKLYIKEAIARFINKEEFKKWYLDTFNKQFVE